MGGKLGNKAIFLTNKVGSHWLAQGPPNKWTPWKTPLALETKHESRAGMRCVAYSPYLIWRQASQMRKTKAATAVAASSTMTFTEWSVGIFMFLQSRKFGPETHWFKPVCLLTPFHVTSDKAYFYGSG